MTTSTARRLFAEIVNRAYYASEATVITRRGKDLAAVVPMPVLHPETDLPKKKPARPALQEKKRI